MKHIKEIRYFILNEFITNDLIEFKDYLEIPESKRKSLLPYEYPNLIKDFLSGKSYKVEGSTNKSKVSWLEKNNKKVYNSFAEYIYKRIVNRDMPLKGTDYPSWAFFKDPDIIRNQWLIHFTPKAKEIAENGFKLGISDLKKLGLTTRVDPTEKEKGGYNFAFLTSEFDKYHKSILPKYGKDAVVFRASGVRVWHEGDVEHQVVFSGKEAKDIVPIYAKKEMDEGVEIVYWEIVDKKGRTIFRNTEMSDIIDWIKKNYNQYKKIL